MGKLIVDGNCVYEIDEDCLKSRRIPEGCKVYEALAREKRNGEASDNEKIARR